MLLQILCLFAVALAGTMAAPLQRTRALDGYDGTLQIRDYTFVRRGKIKLQSELSSHRRPGTYLQPMSCPSCMHHFVSPLRLAGHLIGSHRGVIPPAWNPPPIRPLVKNHGRCQRFPPGEDKRSIAAFNEVLFTTDPRLGAAETFRTNCHNRAPRLVADHAGPSTERATPSISEHRQAVHYGATYAALSPQAVWEQYLEPFLRFHPPSVVQGR